MCFITYHITKAFEIRIVVTKSAIGFGYALLAGLTAEICYNILSHAKGREEHYAEIDQNSHFRSDTIKNL